MDMNTGELVPVKNSGDVSKYAFCNKGTALKRFCIRLNSSRYRLVELRPVPLLEVVNG